MRATLYRFVACRPLCAQTSTTCTHPKMSMRAARGSGAGMYHVPYTQTHTCVPIRSILYAHISSVPWTSRLLRDTRVVVSPGLCDCAGPSASFRAPCVFYVAELELGVVCRKTRTPYAMNEDTLPTSTIHTEYTVYVPLNGAAARTCTDVCCMTADQYFPIYCGPRVRSSKHTDCKQRRSHVI